MFICQDIVLINFLEAKVHLSGYCLMMMISTLRQQHATTPLAIVSYDDDDDDDDDGRERLGVNLL